MRKIGSRDFELKVAGEMTGHRHSSDGGLAIGGGSIVPRKLRLYLTDVLILKVLLIMPDHKITQLELTRMLAVHSDTVTRRLKILERKRLVKILPDLNHMRTKKVMATERTVELKELILALPTREVTAGRIFFEVDTTACRKRTS